MKGKIKWLNKAFENGFILPDAGTVEVFFNKSSFSSSDDGFQSLILGQAVEYEVIGTSSGPRAKNLRLLKQG